MICCCAGEITHAHHIETGRECARVYGAQDRSGEVQERRNQERWDQEQAPRIPSNPTDVRKTLPKLEPSCRLDIPIRDELKEPPRRKEKSRKEVQQHREHRYGRGERTRMDVRVHRARCRCRKVIKRYSRKCESFGEIRIVRGVRPACSHG